MTLPANIHPHTLTHYLKRAYDLPDLFYIDTWPLGHPILAIVDPEVANHVTVQHSLPKHPALESTILPITGPGSLVALDGPEHKRWRTIFNPGFSSAHLMTLVPGIVDDCMVFKEILSKHADRQDVLSLEVAATGVTVDVIGRVVLDAPMHAQTAANQFVVAFRNQLRWILNGSEFNPLVIYNPLRPLIFRYNEYKMDTYLLNVIKKRIATRHQSEAQGKKRRAKPIIDIALDIYLEEEGEKQGRISLDADFQSGALTHIKLFMFGGHDTTSSTICYAMLALSTHTECLRRFRAECDEVFGSDPKNTSQKIKDDSRIVNRLVYTMAIIKETLRLWPAASSVRTGEPGYFIEHDCKKFPTEGSAPLISHLHWSYSTGL